MSASIGIAEAIDRLRDELGTARREGENHEIGFEIVEAEVELLLELRKEGAGKADVGFGVVSVGADGRLSSANTHKVTLKLAVSKRGGGRLPISSANGARWEDEEQN